MANSPSLSLVSLDRPSIVLPGQPRSPPSDTENNHRPAIQQFITSVEGIPADDQLIFASGHVLDGESFGDLTDGCQIEVTTRLLGGKVHGSLARAGKVKGQTPKVEKQTKKRKKCGRARRRILFQKRFSNAVNATGKPVLVEFVFSRGTLSTNSPRRSF